MQPAYSAYREDRLCLNAQRSGESAFALNKCGKPLYGDNLGVFYAND